MLYMEQSTTRQLLLWPVDQMLINLLQSFFVTPWEFDFLPHPAGKCCSFYRLHVEVTHTYKTDINIPVHSSQGPIKPFYFNTFLKFFNWSACYKKTKNCPHTEGFLHAWSCSSSVRPTNIPTDLQLHVHVNSQN